ncbi:ribulose-phosphate 3-epimerase [Tetragenococcus solitarius]|uniref:Ribulose-phosphate 3-epimerase n=1 Tax=Tetragenococcus solitarius TaxID=71453 RepID=A0ABP6KNV5_9ENTE|nr:ribulose-phosphate 3-epimerase [Tetragenococcus solitarius]
MQDILLCPSMMCADFSKLESEMTYLNKANVDVYHVDVMDGVFVPNFALGIEDLKAIKKLTDKPVDVHLMISHPNQYVEQFADLGADIIYFHPETDPFPISTINKIKNKGKKVGVAVNPETSLAYIKELLPLCDYLLIMTVVPGFAGQKYLEFVNEKIKDAIKLTTQFNFEVMVDGAISAEKVHELSTLGVRGFILGTSALFNKEENYSDLIDKLKNTEVQ